MVVLSIILALFFGMNMGGSGLSPSFAASYGAGIITRKRAIILFGLLVLLGALLAGGEVIKTISRGIVPQEFVDPQVALIVLLSASLGLLFANLLRVPLSTSSVTVFSLVGVGLYFGHLNFHTLIRLFLFWLILPFVSYFLTYLLGKLILPLEKREWIKRHIPLIKVFALISGCYVAFSIGSNNVANAVGPLVGGGILERTVGIILIAPCFGIGAFLFGRGILTTVGKEITGIGLLGAVINGMVIGSSLLFASLLGIPEPLVMLDATSVMAIGSVNSGHRYLINHQVVRKIVSIWIINPIISLAVAFILLKLFRV